MYYRRLPIVAFLTLSLLLGCGQRRASLVDSGTKTPSEDNSAPIALAGTFRFEQDKPYSDRVTASDADNDPLTYSVVASPQHGTLSLSNSGTFTFTPAANYVGTDSFAFVAYDGQDRSLPALISLEMTAKPVVNAPSGTFTVVPETGTNFLIGGKASLTWAIVDATSCQLNGTPVNNSGTALSGVLSGPINFILECTGTGGVRSFAQAIAPINPASQITAPTNLVGNATSSSSITLNWEHDGSNALTYKIEQSKTTPAVFVEVGSVSVSERSYIDSGLTPSTDYQYRVRAASGSNNSAYSNLITVRTQNSTVAAPPNPSGLFVSSNAAGSLNVSWTGGGGSTSGYLVASALGSNPPFNCDGGSSTTSMNSTLTGLNPFAEYSVRVCAVNSSDVRSVGVVTTNPVRTMDNAPALVSGLIISGSTPNSLTVAWGFSGSNLNVGGEFLIASQQGASAPADCSAGNSPVSQLLTARSYQISGLQAGSVYSLRVCTRNGNGSVNGGMTLTGLSTTPALPPNLSGFGQIAPTATSLNISWAPPGGSTSGYLLAYASGMAAPADCSSGISIPGAGTSNYLLQGLTPSTTYSLRLCSVNSASDRSSGVTTIITTPSDPNAIQSPSGLSVIARTTNSLSIAWSPVTNASSYLVRYAAGTTAPADCTNGASTTGNSMVIGTLTPDTDYSIRVCTVDSSSARSAGSIISDRTSAAGGIQNPTFLTVGTRTYSSLRFTWAAVSGASYYLVKMVSGITPPADCSGVSAVYSTEATFNSLNSESDYSVRVCAVDSASARSSGAVLTDRTSAASIIPPPNILGFNQVVPSSNSINVSWFGAGGSTASYLVQYAYGSNPPANCTGGVSVPLNSSSYTIPSLSSNSTYSIRVCSVNTAGDVSSGLTTVSSTLPSTSDVPSDPLNVTIGSITSNSFVVSWASGSANTTGYIAVAAVGTTAPSCSNGNIQAATTATFMNSITPDTSYSIRVCAVSGTGQRSPGYITSTRTLAVNTPPPEAIGLVINQTQTTSSSLSLSWTSAGGTAYRFAYKYAQGTTGPTTCDSSSSIATSSNLNYTSSITGLNPSTTYTIRVCSEKTDGTRSAGVLISGTTSATSVPAPTNPTVVSVPQITDTSLSLSWQGGSSNTSYRVTYALGSTPPVNCDTNGSTTSATVSGLSYTMTGLIASSTYSIRICGVNTAGTRSTGFAFQAATTAAPAATPPDPYGVTVTQKTQNSVTLSWQGTATSYALKYAAGSTPAACDGSSLTTISPPYTISGLSAGTSYTFRVCGANAATGVKSTGVLAYATTDSIPTPANPINSGQSQKTANSIDFYWTAGDTTASYYLARLAAGASPPESCVSGGIAGFSVYGANHVAFTGLTANTVYTARICAVNSAGVKSSGLSITVSTSPPAPPAPYSIVTPGTMGTNSIAFAWSSGGGTTVDYMVKVVQATAPAFNCSGGTVVTTPGYTHTGASASTMYSISVCARNSAGVLSSPASIVAQTAGNPTPSNPVLGTTEVTNSTIRLNWGLVGGVTTNYAVNYVSGSTPPSSCTNSMVLAGGTYMPSGLSPSTTYAFRVCGMTAQGVMSTGVTTTATTLANDPTSIGATVTATAITLTWQSGSVGTASYVISYLAGNSAPPAYCPTGAGTSGTSAYSPGLASNTTYTFRVCAVNSAGAKSQGMIISRTTLALVPSAPTSLSLGANTSTKIPLSWGPGANATTYAVRWSKGLTIPSNCANGTYGAVVTGTSYTVTGLEPNTNYSFLVCSIISTGNYTSGVSGKYSTANIPPNPRLTSPAITANSIRLNWTSGGGTTAKFRVAYAQGTNRPNTCQGGQETTGNYLVLTGLASKTNYAYRVCAVDGDGQESNGDVGTTKTN